MKSDTENIGLADSTDYVDETNAKFYGRFQFPWVPMTFHRLTDPDFETVMLNQSIGAWQKPVVPHEPRIWVAGCGTNQAVYTALRFPRAAVLGSDLSANSLGKAARQAKQLGITNLELKEESINQAAYKGEFDYVICTGVIHHNAEPRTPLLKLAEAMKQGGVLELMVYNRYQRIMTTAFQKALRVLEGNPSKVDFEWELRAARKIINGFKIANEMTRHLEGFKDVPEAQLADYLLQPVEYSYTIESFEDLVTACGLEIIAPCINPYDKVSGFFWDLEFDDAELQDVYDALPDSQRWQVSNHLMLESSPMLWFYLQRRDSGRPRKRDRKLCEEFLNLRFKKGGTEKVTYLRTEGEEYDVIPRRVPYPGLHPDPLCRKIVEEANAQTSGMMRVVLDRLGVEANFAQLNKLRYRLTTNAFPYLVAAS
jgi:SAM-dependent methyltransferase